MSSRALDGPPIDPRRLLEEIPAVLAAAICIDTESDETARDVWLATRAEASSDEVRRQALERLRGIGLIVPPGAVRVGCLPAAGTAEADATNAAAVAPLGVSTRLLVLEGISVRRSGDRQIQCEVKLLRKGVELRGTSEDLDTATGRARAGARATLIAAGTRQTPGAGATQSPPARPIRLDALQVVEAFGRRYAVLSVETASGSNERRLLTGAAAVDASPEQAGCRATLGALERWLDFPDRP